MILHQSELTVAGRDDSITVFDHRSPAAHLAKILSNERVMAAHAEQAKRRLAGIAVPAGVPKDFDPVRLVKVMSSIFPEDQSWRDAGSPVFELSQHAAFELILTSAAEEVALPAESFWITLPTPGTLESGGFDVSHIFVTSAKAQPFSSDAQFAFGLLPNVEAFKKAHAGRSRNNQVIRLIFRENPDTRPDLVDPKRMFAGAINLVFNLAFALTHRERELLTALLPVRLTGIPRPRVTRVKMRTPRIDLAPHVQRFLIGGERAFAGKRAHHVMGFFRRRPGELERSIWVRPHVRGGKLGDAAEPHITAVVKTKAEF